jgi:hypothetical protein
MPFATTAKNLALDAITVDRIRLHSGNPGSAGTDNALGAGLSAATFNAASSAERALASGVTVTGLAANQSVTHFSIWLNSGTVFRGGFAITSGDTQANSAGEFTLATGTKLVASDPA